MLFSMLINEEVREKVAKKKNEKKKNFFNERDYSVKGVHFFFPFLNPYIWFQSMGCREASHVNF